MAATKENRVYVVSKVKHASKWRELRSTLPIISSWIDDGAAEDIDFTEAWPRYLQEAASCRAMLVYVSDDDRELKGGLLEIGAALSNGATVFVVGEVPALVTAQQHDRVVMVSGIAQAVSLIWALFATPLPEEDPQRAIANWVVDRFGANSLTDKMERGLRNMEESIEMFQTVPGAEYEHVLKVARHVFSREIGDPMQEAAGVGLTLMAFCEAHGFRLEHAVQAELERIEQIPRETFQKKLAMKVDAGISVIPPFSERRGTTE